MSKLSKVFLAIFISIVFSFALPTSSLAVGAGNCLNVPDSQKDNEGLFSLTAPVGYYVSGLAIKSGQECLPSPDGNVYTENGIYEPDNDGNINTNCYQVSGLGTTTATAVKVGLGNGQICQNISHIEVQVQQLGTITIQKNAINDSDQEFTFQNNFGNNNPSEFILVDDNAPGFASQSFFVTPGSYVVSEDSVDGWQQENAVCDGGETIDSIDVASGEHITCTFTNQKLATITLIKNTVGGNGTFNFQFTGAGLPESSQVITSNNSGSTTFNNLDPDLEYSINEVIQPGWLLTNSECTGSNTPGEITPNNGEDIICTFTNVEIKNLEISKTALTSFTRTFNWTIDKSVSPKDWDLFKGDTGTSEYTVSVNKDDGHDNDFAVSGTITIHNPNTNPTLSATINAVSDLLVANNVNCGVSFPYILPADSTLNCTYSGTLPNGNTTTNTAVVTTTGQVPGGSGDAAVIFGEPSIKVNDAIDVTDDKADTDPWHFTDDGEQTYEHVFSCNEDRAFPYDYEYKNIASIVGTNQSADATVTVHCYDPIVTKNAETSLDRTWTWTIDKSADQTELTLAEGEVFTINYDVTVDATSQDSNWIAEGEIDVWNNAPIPALINNVTDLIEGGIEPAVDCGSFPRIIEANQHLICTYSSKLSDTTTRINTATAIQQNFDYNSDEEPTPSGTTEYSGTAEINFAEASINEIDEEIDVDDTLEGFLGTVSAEDAPHTFSYSRDLSFDTCGDETVSNTASFVTNDTSTPGSDNWDIEISIPCYSCSLTQGYWKTHSQEYGPAAHPDDTWDLVGGPNALFFISNKSYIQVLQTTPKGNAYYILAHQYIAAELNQENGAGFPSEIQVAFDDATTLFDNHLNTPANIAALKGKSALRKQFIELAGILGAFNEGTTNPAGHCDEQI